MSNGVDRGVGIIYEDIKEKIKPQRLLIHGLISLGGGVTVKVVESIAAVIVGSQKPGLDVLLSKLPEHFWIFVVGGIGALLGSLYGDYRKISRDWEELESLLRPVYPKSLPKLKDGQESLLNKMRHEAFHSTDHEKQTIVMETDPKLFAALDYAQRVVSKMPPRMDLNATYINDIFNCKSLIYTLWTDEPSIWLDPMIQFYLTNLGFKNLLEYERTLNPHPFKSYDKDAKECAEFQQFKSELTEGIARKATSSSDFKMVRIVLLREGWDDQYKEELSILAAMSELFHFPCLFMKKGPLLSYIDSNSTLQNELITIFGRIKSLIIEQKVLRTDEVNEKFLFDKGSRLELMGLLVLDGDKFYIYTEDRHEPFKCISDEANVGKELFELLVKMYCSHHPCRHPIQGERFVRKHNAIVK